MYLCELVTCSIQDRHLASKICIVTSGRCSAVRLGYVCMTSEPAGSYIQHLSTETKTLYMKYIFN